MIDSFHGPYRWLSNFWIVPVIYEGHQYPSVEHAYVAAKTTDEAMRAEIRAIEKPGQVKRLGRQLALREDWEAIKLDVMEELLRSKFRQQHLRNLLLSTGSMELIEGNTWGDRFWGVCDGVGENHLGKLLMKLREEYAAL